MSGMPVDPISQTTDSTDSADVAVGHFSPILNQIENGVAVRMVVLYLLAGGE